MKPTDLLAIVSSAQQESVFLAAESLAQRWGARLVLLHLAHQPEPIAADPVNATGLWAEVLKQAHEVFQAEFGRIEQRAAKLSVEVEVKHEEVLLGTVEEVMTRHGLHADLVLMQAPSTESDDLAFEGALFRSGRPVLLVPEALKSGEIGKRVLVAWKPKREAARAVWDAAPFLEQAERVAVVTVDAQREAFGQSSGPAIVSQLLRKGVKAELRAVETSKGETAEAKLLQEALALGADLIVMGGYGHSRLREFVFGGVTRSLSRSCPVPVLMSH